MSVPSQPSVYHEWIEVVKSDEKSQSTTHESSYVLFKCLALFIILVIIVQFILWLFKAIPSCLDDDDESTVGDSPVSTNEVPVQQTSSSISMDGALMPYPSATFLSRSTSQINDSNRPQSPSAIIRVTEVYFK